MMIMETEVNTIPYHGRCKSFANSQSYTTDHISTELALLDLMEKTGYDMVQQNGQRKYGGPPPGWEGPTPPRGCEIFIGRIPRDCYENELVPIFEQMGKIYELRLMMDFSGSNKGYAFVMYTCKEDAVRAVKELNNYEIRRGKFLGVCVSVDNCRLFVGGIPKSKNREDIYSEMVKVTDGVVDVIVYPSATDKSKNRGFAFVEYDSHRSAAMARRKLLPGQIQLWGHQIAVDWAEPENEVDEGVMKTVKILYVRNLMLDTSEEVLEQLFNKAADPQPAGKKAVERVKKLNDYAFIHFSERAEAQRALTAINGSDIDGSKVEVVWAKPVNKSDPARQKTRNAFGQTPAFPSFLQPNMIPALPYDPQTLSAYYAQLGAFPQQSALSGQMAGVGGGLARMPLRGRGRAAAGSRAAGARVYGTRRKSSSPAEVLEALCLGNGWGMPIYQLNVTDGFDKQYIFKVVIPGFANGVAGAGTYIPNKLSRTVEEAQSHAAECVLMSLSGNPYDPNPAAAFTGWPGYIPASLPMPMGALNYMGQPIQAPIQPGLGNPELANLAAVYAMQGIHQAPVVSQPNVFTHAQTPWLMAADTNGNLPIQLQQNANELSAMTAIGVPGVGVMGPPSTSVDSFAHY